MKFTEKLETGRLILRKIDNSDINFIYKHFSNDDINEYLTYYEPTKTIEEAQKIIDFYLTNKGQSHFRWCVVNKENDQVIGTCGYHNLDVDNKKIEIGYDLSKEYWGKGIMSESLSTIIDDIYSNTDINRIEAFIHLQNIRSYELLKKLKFHTEGIIRDKDYFRGKFYDHYIMSLLRKDWL